MGRIKFVPVAQLSCEQRERHRAYSRSLGLPELGSAGAVAPSLAVVGGSPDVDSHVDRLLAWDGEIWAINGAFRWCRAREIAATYYCIDPLEMPVGDLSGVERAVLGDFVHPSVFDALLGQGAHIELVRFGEKYQPQTTAAATVPALAMFRGHRRISYFGCESSFGERTHAYKHESPNFVWVECGGEEFVTSPQMIMQAEEIAEAARAYPQYIAIAGGGFLPALVRHGDYAVTHISPALDRVLKENAA